MEGFNRKLLLLLIVIVVSIFLYLKPFTYFGDKDDGGQITIVTQPTYDDILDNGTEDKRNKVEESDYITGSPATTTASGTPASGSPSEAWPHHDEGAGEEGAGEEEAGEEDEEYQPPAGGPSAKAEDNVVDMDMYLSFVHGQCKKHDMPASEKGTPRLLLLPKNYEDHNILYASNPKSGSTSFKKWLQRVQGSDQDYLEMHGVHAGGKYTTFKKLKLANPDIELEDLIQPFYKVGFVRNPITRLISGFRDKVLRRPGSGNNKKIYKHDPSVTIDSPDTVKFKVFLDLILSGEVDTEHITNVHFSSQWRKMMICDWPYDFLGQTETTTQQIKLVQANTATGEFEFPGSRAEQGQDSIATVQLAHKFYDGISAEVMDKLYTNYKWDFILMGYSKLDNPKFPYVDMEQDFSYFTELEDL